ncbi:OLC1v1036405C1 [Oldenlandia corymbosa var. corymbosa]|uniref:OLC1v1036405C1 n=1 Tax=Oldenlandia corymbosa var. corymbosa TaxID=529605 RepID=A0AAV1CWH0_OLDCO|nr:OLC1v1036405C1 [Oldenlandia corymbosa var. corymbosa]
MQPQNMSESLDLHRYLAAGTPNYDFPPVVHPGSCNSSSFFSMDVISGITDDFSTSPEAKAFAASQQHKEAERRRRERINSHLDRLRTILSCNSKTDKASLLAKVVQRVRDLKQKTSETLSQLELESFPAESDEISVQISSIDDSSADDGGRRLLIKASLCCEDRSDLLPELIETLKSLHLSPLRAEMITLGGRIKNVIILSADKDHHDIIDESIPISLRNALKSLVQRSNYGSGECRTKRRRVFDQGIAN